MCSVSRARKVVYSLAVLAGVGYSFGIWTSGVIESNGVKQCRPLPEYIHILTVLNNIDTVITLIIPSAAIFAMNIRIMYKIMYVFQQRSSLTSFPSEYKHSGRDSNLGHHGGVSTSNMWQRETVAMLNATEHNPATQKLSADEHSSDSSSTRKIASTKNGHQVGRHHKDKARAYSIGKNTAQIKITKMLLVISTIFLLLNLPKHALLVYDFLMGMSSESYRTSLTVVLLQQAFTMIYNLNFAINFFLYSLCGKNFRAALCRLTRKIHLRLTQSMCFPFRNTRWYHHRTQSSIRRNSGASIRQPRIYTRGGSTRFTRC